MSPDAQDFPILLERSGAQALAARLLPFWIQGVVSPLALHAVDHLAALCDERDPDVVLALCLAVMAPTRGHICIDLSDREGLRRLVDLEAERDKTVLETLPWPEHLGDWLARIDQSPLIRRPGTADRSAPFVLDAAVLYTDRYFTYQRRLAVALRSRVRQPCGLSDPPLLQRGLRAFYGPSGASDAVGVAAHDTPRGTSPLDRQQLGAAMALLRGLTIISGGPGTGKTYTVRTILTLLYAQWLSQNAGDAAGPSVALAAPTGKAAARMQQALGSGLESFLEQAAAALPHPGQVQQLNAFLGSLVPSTIHRLLGYDPTNPTRFRHHADRPLRQQIIIVDEASMIDFALMTKLVDAVAPGARLILLGDQHQLASVEAGTVLSDLCGPTISGRLELSRAFVRELKQQAGIDLETLSDISLLDDPGPQDAIVQLDRSRRFSAESGIGRFARAVLAPDFEPRRALQSLLEVPADAAQREVSLLSPPEAPHSGRLGHELEARILEAYGPVRTLLQAGPEEGQSRQAHHRAALESFDRFRILCAHREGPLGVEAINRRVEQLLLGQRPASGAAPVGRERASVEHWMGRPILIGENDALLGRFNGDVGLIVPGPDGEPLAAFAEATGISYLAPARLPRHQTVFAMTIHKSQGSEFDEVLVMLPSHSSPILTRELIYTAVTRARRRVMLVGERGILIEALGRSVRRASGLQAELWGGRGATGRG
ncbi:MAG: exodeoxyribonuclease V subunit alpha [Myxococcales bacterium]|nr:exodeoxyribonuclease V subunit alpha [Myxococcales bacterium]